MNFNQMKNAVRYIVDDNGQKISVVVLYSEWNHVKEQYMKLKRKLDVLTGIREGLEEVKKARKTGRKLQTLTDFLNEVKG